MKKHLLPLAILSLVLVFMPCSTSASLLDSAFATDLIASQHYDIGDVIVSNDATHLYVTFMVDIVWLRLYETHVHAATLPERARVRLDIHDVRGRRVARLLDSEREAGRLSVVWNGRDGDGRPLPSGVYFARLSAGERVDSHKLVLVK